MSDGSVTMDKLEPQEVREPARPHERLGVAGRAATSRPVAG